MLAALDEAQFERLIGSSNLLKSYVKSKVKENRKLTKATGPDPESPILPPRDLEGTALAIALSSKLSAEISLNKLELSAVELWGNKVLDFELKHKMFNIEWDRHQIPRDVREVINLRWQQRIFHKFLPPLLVGVLTISDEGFEDDQWMSSKTISTEDLYKFLKKTCEIDKKGASFKTGYNELLEFIEGYNLSLTLHSAHGSLERFLLIGKKLHKENRSPLSPYEEKELCKATRKMIERAQRNPDSLLDRAIERIMLKGFQSNEA